MAHQLFNQMWSLNIVCMMTLFHATNGVTVQDLENFLNTHEKIWTRIRSIDIGPKGRRLRCIYAEVRRKDNHRYVYAQHYEVQEQWISQMFNAEVLLSPTKQPVLRIKRRDDRKYYDYTLLYWSRTEQCAIFTVPLSGKPMCEMQTWDDHVWRHVPSCQMAYKKYCPGKQFPIYTRQCSPPRHHKLESQVIFTR
uniref:Putative group i salivary lipocalin n=1 Tax=Rhipicephalus pulchellus TaxID=72859 RepID=L7LR47_RHIPC